MAVWQECPVSNWFLLWLLCKIHAEWTIQVATSCQIAIRCNQKPDATSQGKSHSGIFDYIWESVAEMYELSIVLSLVCFRSSWILLKYTEWRWDQCVLTFFCFDFKYASSWR